MYSRGSRRRPRLGEQAESNWGQKEKEKVTKGANKVNKKLTDTLTPQERCCAVCMKQYDTAESCGGLSLGAPKQKAFSAFTTICNYRFDTVRNRKAVNPEVIETEKLPPQLMPRPPTLGKTSYCRKFSIKPNYCGPKWQRMLDVCKPGSPRKATCVKRADVVKKARVRSHCRDPCDVAKKEEIFLYSHVMVKVSKCFHCVGSKLSHSVMVQATACSAGSTKEAIEKKCVVDLSKLKALKKCYIKGKPPKNWCDIRKRQGRVVRMRMATQDCGWKCQQEKEKQRKNEKTQKIQKEKMELNKKYTLNKRDECLAEVSKQVKKLAHSRAAAMKCDVRSASQVCSMLSVCTTNAHGWPCYTLSCVYMHTSQLLVADLSHLLVQGQAEMQSQQRRQPYASAEGTGRTEALLVGV